MQFRLLGLGSGGGGQSIYPLLRRDGLDVVRQRELVDRAVVDLHRPTFAAPAVHPGEPGHVVAGLVVRVCPGVR